MPATVYVGLYTAAPSDSGGGTEVSGGAYARQAITFSAAAAGTTNNSAVVTFPTATANWGTITHFALFDASTAGNMLMWSALTTSRVVNTNDIVKFSAGSLTVTQT